MSLYGHISEFDPESDDWAQYIERLEHFFVANEVTDTNKMKSILISCCGSKSYKLMRSLCTPMKPGEKTYDELKALMSQHHNPAPSVIVQRYKFNTKFRASGESVADFVASLRQLTEHCNYGDHLNDMLRDRLVCGINNDSIQRRLLSETTLTFKKALDIALAQETAESNAKDLKRGQSSEVHTLSHKNNSHRYEQKNATGNPSSSECYRCGGRHLAKDCRHRDTECNFCKKSGHLYKMCRSRLAQLNSEKSNKTGHRDYNKSKSQTYGKNKSQNTRTHNVVEDVKNLFDTDNENSLIYHTADRTNNDPIIVTVKVNDQNMNMEVDTGASISLISENTYNKWSTPPTLQECDTILSTYTGENIVVLGSVNVTVDYNKQRKFLPLVVVKGEGPTLLGRNWLSHIRLKWNEIKQVHQPSSDKLQAILSEYSDVFRDELGTLQGTTAKIHVDDKVRPKFFKPRPLPYLMREKVEIELERLQSEGIIEPVQFSDWATPIVPVLKSDGKSIRLCGDYKVTVNSASKLDKYPLPRIEDLYAKLSGGTSYTKLDMNQAYLQLIVDDKSKQYTTINTHRGLFQFNRLPFGISSSPAIFQRSMDTLLQGIPHVVVYLDDILITGETEAEHLDNLREVLRRMSEAGLRLKRSKCMFQSPEVTYLGHKVDAQGLHPTEEKIRAIRDAPTPRNLTELRSFLGIVNYYGKFLPNLSTVLAPLHRLLVKNERWNWNKTCQMAFLTVKRLLSSAKVLVHYDTNREIVVACDASPYGIGSVLSHVMPDGSEHPICFASRTLTPAEKNYSQLDKEGLAIVWGIKKYHQYLYGRSFKILTDHKPLISLFSENKTIPLMASARMIRWGLTLGAYDYSIVYRPGLANSNADALSRLPLSESPSVTPIPGDTVLLMASLNSTLVKPEQIKSWTDEDPLLSRVRDMVLFGWPSQSESKDESLRPYFTRKQELSFDNGCILWGTRVIVPPQGRQDILNQLHSTHIGISRMKSFGRGYVWWPKFDSDLEHFVRHCSECQKHQNKPAEAPLHPWEWPEKPWSRLHIDYAGPFLGKMFLIVIDAHSKWLEICPVTSATSAVTINTLRNMFATHGIPDVVVSDNGTCFVSVEFENFMSDNGIEHIKTAPYHPASNGLAERAVQVFKQGIRNVPGGTIEIKLARFLFRYRTTPQSTTGVAPSELLMGRKLKSHLDMIFPNIKSNVNAKQAKQKQYHDKCSKARILCPGNRVYVCNFGSGEKWLPGVILEKTGPVSFRITLEDGRVIRRHQDHVRLRYDPDQPDVEDRLQGLPRATGPVGRQYPDVPETVNLPDAGEQHTRTSNDTVGGDNGRPPVQEDPRQSSTADVSLPPTPRCAAENIPLRRSTRISKPPEKLTLRVRSGSVG